MKLRCKFNCKRLNRIQGGMGEIETEVGDKTGEQYSRMGRTKEV